MLAIADIDVETLLLLYLLQQRQSVVTVHFVRDHEAHEMKYYSNIFYYCYRGKIERREGR